MKETNTDKRLLFLLDGGDALLRQIDPGNLMGKATVKRTVIERHDGKSFAWSLLASFPDGEWARTIGTASPEGVVVREIALALANQGTWEKVSEKPGETLQEALGPLDRIPARLKRNLVPTVKETAKDDRKTKGLPARLFLTGLDALCYKTEGGNDEGNRDRFSRLKATYNRKPDDSVEFLELTLSCPMKKGAVILEGKLDVFGLYEKKCRIEKDLGLSHRTSAECTKQIKGQDIPSVRAAFDLYETIPTLYSEQLINRNGKGPRLPGTK